MTFEGLEMHNFYFCIMQQYMNLFKMPFDNMPMPPKVTVGLKGRSSNKGTGVLEILHFHGEP